MGNGGYHSLQPAGPLKARTVEIIAAILLVLYALVGVVSINARLSATDDLVGTTLVLGDNGGNTSITQRGKGDITTHVANILSAFLLTATAALLYQVYRTYEPTMALVGSLMFLGAALIAVLSGAIGWVLAQEYISPIGYVGVMEDKGKLTSRDGLQLMESFLEPIEAITGKVSHSFTALGTILYGGLITWTGVLPRWLGWLGLAAGTLMLLFWLGEPSAWFRLDLHFVLHFLGGATYLAWLFSTAAWLFFRGTRRNGIHRETTGTENTDV